jgi:hypothetical protein
LAEFGTDKLSDVLDSELAGVEFEGTYAKALTSPDAVEDLVEELTARIRQQFSQSRAASGLLGETQVDPSVAEQIAGEQLTTWVEGMTVAYLRSQADRGGRAVEHDGSWNLDWPDGTADAHVVFKREPDADTEELLTLEDPRVRGILGTLAPLSPAVPARFVVVPGVSDKVTGLWSLWRVSLQHGGGRNQLFLPLFLSDDGRPLQPTAKLVWERLAANQFDVLGIPISVAPDVLERSRVLAEEKGADVIALLTTVHRSRTIREHKTGERAFAARKRTIERLGLPQVRQKRLADLAREQRQWALRMSESEGAVASLDAVMIVQVGREEPMA